MAKHIQDKRTGKFAGSIGDGKNNIPTAGPRMPAPTAEGDADAYWDLQAATSAYGQRLRELAVTTDTELADLYDAMWTHQQRQDRNIDNLHHALGHNREYIGYGRSRGRGYTVSTADTLDQARAFIDNPDKPEYAKRSMRESLQEYEATNTHIGTTRARIVELDAVYQRHRWQRAFLVEGGHVHASMNCSTCNREGKSTRLVWLPEYSGANEADIVNDAGERACSASCCFPSAPVDVLSRPTRIYSDSERQQIADAEQRRAEREASRAARAAKAPTATGEPLQVEVGTRTWRGETVPAVEELKTERTAITYAVDTLSASLEGGERWMAPYNVAESRRGHVVDTIVSAVAEKRGVAEAEVREEITKKAEAKIRKHLRERARHQR